MLRVEQHRGGVGGPERLHRGSDSQQEGNKILR